MNARRNAGIPAGLLLLLAIGAALVAGCSGSSSGTGESATPAAGTATETSASSGTVTEEQARQAGAIAKAIEAEPNRMDEILQQHSMTAEQFQLLLYDIAQDPTLTEAYEAAKAATP